MNLNYMELTKKYEDYLVSEFEENTDKYIGTSGDLVNEEDMETTAMKKLIDELNVDLDGEVELTDQLIYQIEDRIREGVKNDFFAKFESEISEMYEEQKFYIQDPYAYNGVSQSDFI